MFADLVKAFDTSNHVLMIKILRRYGCPQKLCSVIERMYSNNKVRLVIGKINTPIPFEVGVKQGYSVAPVLFLFLMMAFAETIKKEWHRHGIQKLEFHRHDNSPHSAGRLTGHPTKTFSKGTLFEIFCMLYVNDGAFAFVSRRYLEIGAYLVYKQFEQLGLEMHVGNAKKHRRRNVSFFPHQATSNHHHLLHVGTIG